MLPESFTKKDIIYQRDVFDKVHKRTLRRTRELILQIRFLCICTASSFWMVFFFDGLKVTVPYSRRGLTKHLNAVISTLVFLVNKVLNNLYTTMVDFTAICSQ